MHRVTTDPPLRRALRPRGPVQFGLSERTQSGATVLHVEGELDILTAPKLSAELDAIMRRSTGDVVLDLRDTLFIDSAGLHILLSAHRRLTRASRRMSVVCGDGPVRRVIELARLTETLGVVSGLEG
jgi:anti-sigma B factor antagonist